MPAPRISVFPKCYLDDLIAGRRSYVQWIHDAATLGGEGIEHYDEFFVSYDENDVAPVMAAMAETSQISSMLCFSPDFTHPDPDERQRQVERQKVAIDLTVRFVAGEEIRTEISAKFRIGGVHRELAAAGLHLDRWWTDDDRDFAVCVARPC